MANYKKPYIDLFTLDSSFLSEEKDIEEIVEKAENALRKQYNTIDKHSIELLFKDMRKDTLENYLSPKKTLDILREKYRKDMLPFGNQKAIERKSKELPEKPLDEGQKRDIFFQLHKYLLTETLSNTKEIEQEIEIVNTMKSQKKEDIIRLDKIEKIDLLILNMKDFLRTHHVYFEEDLQKINDAQKERDE